MMDVNVDDHLYEEYHDELPRNQDSGGPVTTAVDEESKTGPISEPAETKESRDGGYVIFAEIQAVQRAHEEAEKAKGKKKEKTAADKRKRVSSGKDQRKKESGGRDQRKRVSSGKDQRKRVSSGRDQRKRESGVSVAETQDMSVQASRASTKPAKEQRSDIQTTQDVESLRGGLRLQTVRDENDDLKSESSTPPDAPLLLPAAPPKTHQKSPRKKRSCQFACCYIGMVIFLTTIIMCMAAALVTLGVLTGWFQRGINER